MHDEEHMLDPVERPVWTVGRIVVPTIIGVLGAAVAYFTKYSELLENISWIGIACIPLGILIVAVAYVLLARRIGRRNAHNLIGIVFGASLVLGAWLLAKYAGHR